jgi:hypothetical protein
MQSPLQQDGGTDGSSVRIVTIDIATGKLTHEYAYKLDNIGTASKPKYPSVSEIVAINDHEFIIDERDGKGLGDGSNAAVKRLYKIDLAGAEDVSNLTGASALAANAWARRCSSTSSRFSSPTASPSPASLPSSKASPSAPTCW